MSDSPHGRHLIVGEWIAGADIFAPGPVTGAANRFARGGRDEIDRAAEAAEKAFASCVAIRRFPRPVAYQNLHEAEAALLRAALSAELFGIRAAALVGKLEPAAALSRLSGLLIGAEVAAACSRFGGPCVTVITPVPVGT